MTSKEGGISGLCNLGNTCYLNSALIVLLNIDELNTYLLSLSSFRRNADSILLKEWMNLYKIMINDNVIVQPTRFVDYVQSVSKHKENDLFTGFDQNDSVEFFHFLIDCFHESTKGIDAEMKFENIPKDIKKFISKRYPTKEMSIVQKVFCGFEKADYIYGNESVSHQFEHFFMIHIPLYQMNLGTIEECLDNYYKDEELKGDNAYFYEKENKKVDVVRRLQIAKCPEILIIHLKRWNPLNMRKVRKKVMFDLDELDLSKYTTSSEDSKYKLFGIINHSGNIFGGHYYTYIKRNKQWLCFNDENIRKIDKKQVISDKNYCLFYRKIK